MNEIASLIHGLDIIITEGYKKGDKPKIEVFRSVMYPEPLCQAQELLTIASDVSLELGVPCFGLDDASGLVDLNRRWRGSNQDGFP
ncbi:MAG: molybdopterin-guanine dinucleotide biosynthesis protein B [Bacillota bacterium]